MTTLDQTIRFTGAQTAIKCPFPLRIIKSKDEATGNEITILTNIFDRTAYHIARLYRARWNIEIFFKTIKQNLRIKKFYGKTENAVKTQIWIALIIYLLYLKLRQMSRNAAKNFTHFVCELSVCLFQRKDLFGWFAGIPPGKPPAVNCLQPELDLSRMFFKNDLIYLFLFTLIIFIISLPIKNKIKYTEASWIVFDFIILFLGISFYIGLSLYTNFRLLKFYRFYSILFIQSFLVYPIIFILKKISLKCSKT